MVSHLAHLVLTRSHEVVLPLSWIIYPFSKLDDIPAQQNSSETFQWRNLRYSDASNDVEP